LADNETVTVTSVPFTCAFAADTQEFDLGQGPVFGWSCEIVEAP